jgi:hypothetical protein
VERAGFKRYQNFWECQYGIDWTASPIPPEKVEELNLARNDMQHSETYFGMTRRQGNEHREKFPDGLFAHEVDKNIYTARSRDGGYSWPMRLYVTDKTLAEAIRRVELFSE